MARTDLRRQMAALATDLMHPQFCLQLQRSFVALVASEPVQFSTAVLHRNQMKVDNYGYYPCNERHTLICVVRFLQRCKQHENNITKCN